MIYLNQAASLSLIYTYRATNGNTTMVKCDDVKEYEKIVNQNLKDMNSKVYDLTPDYLVDKNDLFFTYQNDIEEIGYYVLKNDSESVLRRKRYIMSLPLDIILASQRPNALEAINLVIVDGKILKKDDSVKKILSLYKKH